MSTPPVAVDQFLLFKSLKKGGMAQVFLGFDRQDPTHLVAVKTLLPKLSRQRLYLEMFRAEGKIGVRLDHPNIVRTIDHGETAGNAYIAMDYIFGADLSTMLRKLRKQGAHFPVALGVGLARQVCRALVYAHELTDEYGRPLHIVNRDVSPGNVMISFDGRVHLIDFGIAQTTIDVKSQIGSIKGKISYMAPEQVRGLPVDHRVDLFSLGTVLYEMLTGVQVFRDEGDFATMERVRAANAPPASSHSAAIDEGLDRLLVRAMARETVDRYQTAREMLDDLDAWLTAQGHEVRSEDLKTFVQDLFDGQIDQIRADIDAALQVALETEPTVEAAQSINEASAPPRLISEGALEELDKPPVVEVTQAPRGRVWPWLPLLLVLGVAILWAVVGGP